MLPALTTSVILAVIRPWTAGPPRRGHFIRADRLSALPAQALRVHGNMDGAHADNPQSAADRLTRQQVDDGTHDLLKRRDIVLGIH